VEVARHDVLLGCDAGCGFTGRPHPQASLGLVGFEDNGVVLGVVGEDRHDGEPPDAGPQQGRRPPQCENCVLRTVDSGQHGDALADRLPDDQCLHRRTATRRERSARSGLCRRVPQGRQDLDQELRVASGRAVVGEEGELDGHQRRPLELGDGHPFLVSLPEQ